MILGCVRACRYAGLDCHLVLRGTKQGAERDPGMVGNLLVDRMVGAHIHQVIAVFARVCVSTGTTTAVDVCMCKETTCCFRYTAGEQRTV